MFSGIFLSLTEAQVLGKHLISLAQTTCVFIFILTRLLQNWALFQAASVLMDKKDTFFFTEFPIESSPSPICDEILYLGIAA